MKVKNFKTQEKNSKLKQKTQTSSKKLKDSANPLGLLAENASKKKAALSTSFNKSVFKLYAFYNCLNSRQSFALTKNPSFEFDTDLCTAAH